MNSTIRICFFSILVITLIIAIWSWKYYKKTSERYFLWFLLYELVLEVSGFFYFPFFGNNSILYNFNTIISFLFYFFWFHKVLKKRKWIVYVSLSIFILSFTYEAIVNDSFRALHMIPFFTGALGVFILTISYFVELINSNTIVVLKHLQKFWIVIGLLFFCVGFAYMLLLFNVLGYSNNTFRKSVLFLNITYFCCLIYGFLCVRKSTLTYKKST